jgi:hypothetical protein
MDGTRRTGHAHRKPPPSDRLQAARNKMGNRGHFNVANINCGKVNVQLIQYLMATDLDIVYICEASQAHTEKAKIDQILGKNRFWCSQQQTTQQKKSDPKGAVSLYLSARAKLALWADPKLRPSYDTRHIQHNYKPPNHKTEC